MKPKSLKQKMASTLKKQKDNFQKINKIIWSPVSASYYLLFLFLVTVYYLPKIKENWRDLSFYLPYVIGFISYIILKTLKESGRLTRFDKYLWSPLVVAFGGVCLFFYKDSYFLLTRKRMQI